MKEFFNVLIKWRQNWISTLKYRSGKSNVKSVVIGVEYISAVLSEKIKWCNKSTQRAQTSLGKAAHYANIAQISNLESQHGDPDHPINLINCSLHLAELSWKLHQNQLMIGWVNGQISDWTDSDPDDYQNLITCSIYHPGPLAINSQWSPGSNNVANRQTTNQRYQKHHLLGKEVMIDKHPTMQVQVKHMLEVYTLAATHQPSQTLFALRSHDHVSSSIILITSSTSLH